MGAVEIVYEDATSAYCRRSAGGTGRHYDMRATFITLAIEDGADPEILETRVTHPGSRAARSTATTAGCTGSAGVEIHRTPTKPSACCTIKSLASRVIRWSRPVIWWHRAERSGEGSFRRLAAQTAEGGGERNRRSRHRRDRDKL
jgi:hypothetical protein